MKTEDIVEAIGTLDAADLGEVMLTAIERLGELGREGREALAPLLSGNLSTHAEEGIGQLTEIEVIRDFA